MRTHTFDTVSVRTISRSMLFMAAFSLCMILALAAPWRTSLAQVDATTSEPCSDSDAQRGTTVKGSKSNSDNRTMDAEATTVKGSKSNSSERQTAPCAATTVKSSKSNSSERQMATPPPLPAEASNLNLSKSNINKVAEPPPAPAESTNLNLNLSKSNINAASEDLPLGGAEEPVDEQ